MTSDAALTSLMRAIARGNHADALRAVTHDPALASARLEAGASRQHANAYFLDEIRHHVYEGDTGLHVAAAAYDANLVREFVALGANVGAVNRRGAQALHYAVDGGPSAPRWDPDAQQATVACLLELGADVNATDKNGTTPLLRAVRNRCAAAVATLLDAGANPDATNKRGSTALDLAQWTTGKSGSGTPAARAQQAEIIRLLQR